MSDAKDAQVGIAIRFIKQFDIEVDRAPTRFYYMAMISCPWLGHTFDRNPEETHCTVCGAVKLVSIEERP